MAKFGRTGKSCRLRNWSPRAGCLWRGETRAAHAVVRRVVSALFGRQQSQKLHVTFLIYWMHRRTTLDILFVSLNFCTALTLFLDQTQFTMSGLLAFIFVAFNLHNKLATHVHTSWYLECTAFNSFQLVHAYISV